MPRTWKRLCLAVALALVASIAAADDPKKPTQTLVKNVYVFDGVREQRIENASVLVEGNLIKKVSAGVIDAPGASVIDGGGRTLVPGLTDSHVHIMWSSDIDQLIYSAPEGYLGAVAAVNAERMLMRGFTTVRDMGGPSFGLKKAIDEGIVPGPRILPSGAFVSQSSGHGDFEPRLWYLSPHFTGQLDKAYLRGWTTIADGVAEVMKATRENLRYGASQIKIMGSGSITGAHDPLDVTEYTYDELRAIVTETEKWGTYATVHCYSDEGIRNALNAGVKSVEHALFATKKTLRLMKKKDVFFSSQWLSFTVDPAVSGMTGEALEKYKQAQASAKNAFNLAKKLGLKISWGTDILGMAQKPLDLSAMQSQEFVARSKYFTGYEIMKQTTSLNAELFERSRKRHPYREGKLGVIEEGAYADLLIVDGNPLEDISLLAKPDESLVFIMKDGTIYKNNLN
jgi:imidazolonepropionase-like amidohydrolase